MATLELSSIPFLNPDGTVSHPWLLYLQTLSRTQVTVSGSLVSGDFILGGGTAVIQDSGYSVVPPSAGGTGTGGLTGLLQGHGTSTATAVTDSSTVGAGLKVVGASSYAFGATDLTNSQAVTGILPIVNGGTNSSTQVWIGTTGNQSGLTGNKTWTDGNALQVASASWLGSAPISENPVGGASVVFMGVGANASIANMSAMFAGARTSDAAQNAEYPSAFILMNHDYAGAGLNTGYGIYLEAWNQSTSHIQALQGQEIAVINLSSTRVVTDPYTSGPAGLTEGLRIGSGKPTKNGQVVSTALSIINAEDTETSKFGCGILIEDGSIAPYTVTSGDAIAMSVTHNITWFASAGSKALSIANYSGKLSSSGGFQGNVTGNLTGNADTATKLVSAVNIGGTSFDGSANITPNFSNQVYSRAGASSSADTSHGCYLHWNTTSSKVEIWVDTSLIWTSP